MLTYIRVSKNIQKKIKFGWKIRIQHGPDKQDSSKKKCVLMKKLSKLFYLFLQHQSSLFRSRRNTIMIGVLAIID